MLSQFFSQAKLSSAKMNIFSTFKNIQTSENGELNESENSTTLPTDDYSQMAV